MSKVAMSAFHRLRIRPRVDGTALFLLLYLCMRHNDRTGYAWPSIDRISRDLDLPRRTVIDAIHRLERIGLIQKSKGGGRGVSSRYALSFLRRHAIDPESDSPINWANKQCSPPHSLDPGNSAVERQKQCGGTSETVRPTAPDNNKTIKTESEVPAVLDGADARQAAEIIYGPRDRLGPADQQMFDREVERLTESPI